MSGITSPNKTATAIRDMGLLAIEPPGTRPFGHSFAVGKRFLAMDPFFSNCILPLYRVFVKLLFYL